MDSLAGVRGEKLTTPAAFKKLLKDGLINKNALRFSSGKVSELCVCGTQCTVCVLCVVCGVCCVCRVVFLHLKLHITAEGAVAA